MMFQNKYEGMTLSALVKGAQEMHLRREKAREKTKTSSRFIIKLGQELNLVRSAALKKLSEVDRATSAFFPIGVMVEYEHPYTPGTKKNGVVVAHERDDLCIVQFDGEEYQVQVWPGYLTLRFIRSTYN